MRPRLAPILLVLAALSGCRDAPDPARELERRLLAPCCWRQPLRDHTSPLATELRAEIATRLRAGEPAGSIEADLVARHGDRIRALPEGGDPTWVVGAATGTAVPLALAMIVVVLRRRRARGVAPVAVAAATLPAEDEPYADRLDDELLAID
ncbi:MAG TPA: cytochrome c-type biogenesis protein CcmH [Kofleriaceae bacterium]|nr:cytochrome c-type biogenesis protein CcmH [Kofleriaceae bacterium]